MTMTLIETVTVGAAGAFSIEFSNIPQDGTDLLVLVSGRSSLSSPANVFINFNFNQNSTGYNARGFGGFNGNVFNSNSSGNINLNNVMPTALATVNTFNSASLYVANYTVAEPKQFLLHANMENNNNFVSGLGISGGVWNNTAAITNIRTGTDGQFVQHSTASLYKITKA